MVRFTLELLGGFRLTTAGTELCLRTRKAEALLAYLALPPARPHARETLTALLGGERGDAQARHSLSQTLFSIRKVAADVGAPTPVVVNVRGVALDPASVGVDADRFAQLAAAGTPAALGEAGTLCQGDLL
jgi:DNA-binding SARP family transcriptional activator